MRGSIGPRVRRSRTPIARAPAPSGRSCRTSTARPGSPSATSPFRSADVAASRPTAVAEPARRRGPGQARRIISPPTRTYTEPVEPRFPPRSPSRAPDRARPVGLPEAARADRGARAGRRRARRRRPHGAGPRAAGPRRPSGRRGRGPARRGLRPRPRGGPARAGPAAVRRAGPRRPRPRAGQDRRRWPRARARRSPRSRPSFLHALAGRGAHVLTFNDYLARRDAAWMGPVYERLGLSVGFVQERMSVAERQRGLRRATSRTSPRRRPASTTSATALALEPGDRAQRAYHFALVDEADSILIDEARIPLVIAGETGEALAGPERLAALVRGPAPRPRLRHRRARATTSPSPRRAPRASRRPSAAAASTRSRTSRSTRSCATPCTPSTSCGATWTTSCGEGRSSSWTSRPAAWPTSRHWPDGLHAAVEAKEGLRLTSRGPDPGPGHAPALPRASTRGWRA